jgi:hypothetical protein
MQIQENLNKNVKQIITVTNLDLEDTLSAIDVLSIISDNETKIYHQKNLDSDCEMICGSFEDAYETEYFFFCQESKNELFMPEQKKQQILSIFVSTDWNTLVQFGMTQEARSAWKL